MAKKSTAWIGVVPEEEAAGELAGVYASFKQRMGFVPNVMQVSSLKPPTLSALAQLIDTVMHGESGLSRQEREMVALAVSAANRCRY